MTQSHIDAEDIAFIQTNPVLLNSPAPRAWSNTCRIFRMGFRRDIEATAVAGTVGAAATRWLDFREQHRHWKVRTP